MLLLLLLLNGYRDTLSHIFKFLLSILLSLLLVLFNALFLPRKLELLFTIDLKLFFSMFWNELISFRWEAEYPSEFDYLITQRGVSICT